LRSSSHAIKMTKFLKSNYVGTRPCKKVENATNINHKIRLYYLIC